MNSASTLPRGMPALHAKLPGIAFAAVLGFAAQSIAGGLGEPLSRNPVLVAMLFGLLIGNCLQCPDALRPGLDFTKRYLLRLAVVLVGFRISIELFFNLGLLPLAVAAAELVLVLALLHWIGRRLFKLPAELALLVAVGSAICGAAAILSVAALTRAKEQHAGIAIALITVSGTVALLVYPIAFLSGWLPLLDERWYGIFVGASIYELAQVYGASFAVSEGALNTATLVKLSKVLMLLPLLVVIGAWLRRKDAAAQRPPTPWPWFIAIFVIVVLVNSSMTLHPQLRRLILEFDQFLFVMVMIALGMTTRLSLLAGPGSAGLGWRLGGVALVGLVLSSAIAYALAGAVAAATSGTSATLATAAGAQSSTESFMLAHPGGRVFASIGCAQCHVPALAGRNGEVPLYSDLLLHDMGPALDDKIAQGSATGADWRTTPLIGLGLRQRYLHDGRALTLRDAILAHGGEAQIVSERFFELAAEKQQAVMAFLDGL
jgi:uncharacterized integral membrane protein (TIGR00698 family)